MKQRKTWNFIAVTGVLLAALAFSSCGSHRWHNMPIEKRADKIASRIADKLDLTKEQKAVLEKIKKEAVTEWKANKNERLKLKKEALALAKAKTLDRAKLQAVAAKHNALRAKRQAFVIDKIVEFHKVLTPAQKEKIAAYIEKHIGKMEKQ